jgi:transposase
LQKKVLTVSFKAYQQHQAMLLSPSLDEMIEAGHAVRTVIAVLDKIDIDALLKNIKEMAPVVFIRVCY